mmetsp:Transcript_13707/g.37701  ORF Transcript_13707/g.37701 Transcript_13707/m.37701 type:complete len:225 (+) Transcript_13707:338-1012(+)
MDFRWVDGSLLDGSGIRYRREEAGGCLVLLVGSRSAGIVDVVVVAAREDVGCDGRAHGVGIVLILRDDVEVHVGHVLLPHILPVVIVVVVVAIVVVAVRVACVQVDGIGCQLVANVSDVGVHFFQLLLAFVNVIVLAVLVEATGVVTVDLLVVVDVLGLAAEAFVLVCEHEVQCLLRLVHVRPCGGTALDEVDVLGIGDIQSAVLVREDADLEGVAIVVADPSG